TPSRPPSPSTPVPGAADPTNEPGPAALHNLAGRSARSGVDTGTPLRIPDAQAAATTAALHRALRPLKRRTSAPHRKVIDEAASAHHVAETSTWSLVLRSADERWFDVAVIVDTARSMVLWEPAVSEI